jgi:WXXGXW repeat (2 copies)
MRTRIAVPVLSAMVFGIVLSAATASASTHVYVRIGPPAPVVEVRAVAPGPRYVWIDGYHRWNGRAYVWTPGRWVVPPRAHAVWVPARWVHERRGWYFVEGHWRH